jgi:hypothetical protein
MIRRNFKYQRILLYLALLFFKYKDTWRASASNSSTAQMKHGRESGMAEHSLSDLHGIVGGWEANGSGKRKNYLFAWP